MSGTQSPTSPRYTDYTSVLPDGDKLAEQAKDAGVRAAYANGTRGNTQENRSAVMDRPPEQAKANVSPLNTYTDEKGLSPTDAAEIERHVKDDDLASFRNWVDTLGNEYAKLKKAYDGAGDWHQLRRYIVCIFFNQFRITHWTIFYHFKWHFITSSSFFFYLNNFWNYVSSFSN